MNKRINKLKDYMNKNGLDSLVITDPANMRYIGSYTGEGYLVLSYGGDYLVTDSRYTEQAKCQTKGFEICDIASFRPEDAFGSFKKTGFENSSISYLRYDRFKRIFKELCPIDEVILDMRSVKDEEEIALIAKAEEIGDMAFKHILSYIKPGVSERDIALEIEFFMRRSGAEALSFDTIVATGEHGAMPHAEPDERHIQNNSFLTMDFGCIYGGYCSDMTRTVCVGKATEEMKKVYNTVLRAQLSSMEMIKEGVVASDVHFNASKIIDESYKGMFGHGLGHGVGLDIHENPGLNTRNNNPLKENNVITVEPGIYIPGFCGVRIEDLLVVKKGKYENLTASPKNLMEI